MTWKTLAYLPYFTSTATNIGYTRWSHDIGGHNQGVKDDELYVRSIQFGVFSPILRLHCSNYATMTKDPEYYGNGSGLIAEKFLRLRHKMIPYLYSRDWLTHVNGQALMMPLYYKYRAVEAYKFKNEYIFGGNMIVSVVVTKRQRDGYSRSRVWLPQGRWTDLFTFAEYTIGEGGRVFTALRTLDSIPVFVKSGAFITLSEDEENDCSNPVKIAVYNFVGNGQDVLYEDDGMPNEKNFITHFSSEYNEKHGNAVQKVTITSDGNADIIPNNRVLRLVLNNVDDADVKLYKNGIEQSLTENYEKRPTVFISFEPGVEYIIMFKFKADSDMDRLLKRAKDVLTRVEEKNVLKRAVYNDIISSTSVEELVNKIKASELTNTTKMLLTETIANQGV